MEYVERIQTDYRRIRENANELDDKKTYLAELSRLLQGNIDVGKFEREKVKNDAQLKQKRELEISISMRIGETRNQIESLENK